MKWGLALIGAALTLGCGPELEESQLDDPEELESALEAQPLDACRLVAPDATVYLNSGVTQTESRSDSGAYGYDTSTACKRWVVDFKLATYSTKVVLEGAAYDLPSSSAAGGSVPANAHDCGRYSEYLTFYRKLSSEASFTNLGGSTTKGTWNGSSCQLSVTSGALSAVIAPKSASGWDTYRVAVGVKQRTSWQEVRAYSYQYIEPPH